MGLTLTRCGRHHPSRALTCSLIKGSSLLTLAVGLTCAHLGSRSLAVVLGLTLACSCAGAHTWLTLKSSPHLVVAAAAAPDTSSCSGTGPG